MRKMKKAVSVGSQIEGEVVGALVVVQIVVEADCVQIARHQMFAQGSNPETHGMVMVDDDDDDATDE
jgi:hypothetical protein